MCDNGKYFFYFIRLNTIFLSFIVHFKKSQCYKKSANKCSKTTCKNEKKKLSWAMDYRYTFDFILQGSSRKCLDFDQQFGFLFFFFCFKVFWYFFFELNIFFKFSDNGIKYFTAICLFSAPHCKVPIKLFTRSARISQKIICFMRSPLLRWPLFLHFSLFDLI